MADLETRLHDALGDAGSHTHPSPDLFARVVGSIAEDRARRRRVRTIALLWVAGVALLALLTVTLTPKDEEGMHMPWWILEIATNVVLIGIALWLGPFIKRFGRAYAADVFHDNPQTGKSYIVLTDIVYYLIFTAYILFTIRVDAPVYYLPVTGAPTLMAGGHAVAILSRLATLQTEAQVRALDAAAPRIAENEEIIAWELAGP